MDNIDSEEKAYWLGFFYADAYNHVKRRRVVIELAEKDKEHLIKCANFFGQPRTPFRQEKNKGKYIAYRLELNSAYLCNQLDKLGCHQGKSHNLHYPDWVPENLENHFVRGYFDGDGSIRVHQDQLNCEIVSTKEFCKKLQGKLSFIDVNSQMRKRKKKEFVYYNLCFGGTKQVFRFCEWIYQDASIYLNRNKEVYTSYKERYDKAHKARIAHGFSKQWAPGHKPDFSSMRAV